MCLTVIASCDCSVSLVHSARAVTARGKRIVDILVFKFIQTEISHKRNVETQSSASSGIGSPESSSDSVHGKALAEPVFSIISNGK